ncbi:GNAT family N-acetyltransferase [uncultured Dokdonia sp.]|uniref:GNAT family N-acetyltransferase n=1 Tax=uncultured Dokdonia sp. TaxID=575653 RepID=UPI00263998EB|nr:GNAT family N-acetyltransferase [uncultured Dokdonia sp.]
MNTTIVKTDRLLLRPFQTGDGLHFFQMNADPKVIKYTGDTPFANQDAAHRFIETYDAYVTTGIGRWAVIRTSDDAFLGWCGLKYHPEERVVDIGFRFYRCYWGQGYATESAKAVIHYAFHTLKYPFLVAHAHVDNAASHAVIKKCEMLFVKDFDYDGISAKLYRIDNPEYTLKQITAEETWPVRHPVLRKGRPLEDVYMEADEKPSTFHVGMYHRDTIVGVASFMEDEKDYFTGKQHRLRGMAVLPEYRKKGIAELLLKKGENMLQTKGCTLLWFNARIAAVSFYKNLGYVTVGSEFDIPLVGPHFLMKKELL